MSKTNIENIGTINYVRDTLIRDFEDFISNTDYLIDEWHKTSDSQKRNSLKSYPRSEAR